MLIISIFPKKLIFFVEKYLLFYRVRGIIQDSNFDWRVLFFENYNIIHIMLFADTAGIGFYIISRILSILRLCSAPVVMM